MGGKDDGERVRFCRTGLNCGICECEFFQKRTKLGHNRAHSANWVPFYVHSINL